MGSAVTHDLISALLETSNLKKFSLVDANMSSSSFLKLKQYIAESRSLLYLDISCNNFRSKQMFEIIETLAADRKFVSVDLAWNSIQDAEASLVEPTIGNCAFNKIKKSEQKAIDRTQGQFSALA